MATISIADNDARVQYTQAVTADTTQLTIDFPFFELDNINVIATTDAGVDTVLTRGTGNGTFAVVGTAVDDGFSGGYVTLGDDYANTFTFTIFRDIAVSRTTDFPTSGPFNVSSLNTELDRITAIEQELETKISRTMGLADSDASAALKLPNLNTRKGTVLAFNATSGLPEAGPSIGSVTTVSAQSANINTVAGIAANVTTVAGIQGNVTTVADISTNVSTVAGIQANVTTVAGIDTDVTTVAGKDTEIGLLGTADAVADMNILATADIVSDMNTLATSSNVTNMDTLANISGDITTLSAFNSAHITTVAGIGANVTTVASNDANITAVADNATNINTVAGQATNLQNVTNNLSDIQNADTHAIAAAASQVAAAASAAALAGALDNFADTYLGTMTDTDTASSASTTSTFVLGSSALTVADATGIEIGQNVSATGIPSNANVISIDGTTVTLSHVSTAAGSSVATTFQGYGVFGAFDSNIDGPNKDNDNGNLVTGALYYNSTDGEMRVYDGANWIAASAAGSASMIVYEYTATAGQDTFTGSDDNSASLSYVAGNIQVVMNGIVLDPDDFTATNGTSVVLTSGASLNDVVNVYAFKSFTVADTVSASAGGTFVGNVDFNSGIDVTGTVNATSFVGSGASLTGVEAFPAGTKMLFGQTAAPTGWTKITTDDDAALRIVSGTVGTGGSVGLSTALATPTVTGTISGSTGNHTLTIAQMPAHSHSVSNPHKANNNGNKHGALPNYNGLTWNTNSTGGGGSHSHSLSATFSSGTATINVKYVDAIMASKD